jgi:hypothetical protein
MTKKDYEAIAQRLNFERLNCKRWRKGMGPQAVIDRIIDSLCDVLAAENPKFDRVQFLEVSTSNDD